MNAELDGKLELIKENIWVSTWRMATNSEISATMTRWNTCRDEDVELVVL